MKVLLQVDVMKDALIDMVRKFAQTVPNVFMALMIFLVGYIVSKIVSKVLKKALAKLGIDKIGEKLNEVEIVSKANFEVKLSEIAAKFMYFIMMLFFAVAATSVLGIPEISNLVSDIFTFIPNLIVAMIVMILGTLLADALRKFLHTALTSLGIASAGLISSFLFYFLFINIVIVALSQAKIDTSFLSQNISIIIGGIVAAFAIGYGLASKDVMANMVASFYSRDQFEVGQNISIEGVTGTIVEVTKSSLVIATERGKVMYPISKATNAVVEFLD